MEIHKDFSLNVRKFRKYYVKMLASEEEKEIKITGQLIEFHEDNYHQISSSKS
jgi:hypothetical protein